MSLVSDRPRKEHWTIWYISKTWREIASKEKSCGKRISRDIPLVALEKVLFTLNREFLDRFSTRLLDLEFILQDDGPRCHDLEKIVEEAVDLGLVEYEVTVKIPDAPFDLNPDYAEAIIEHELSRVDAPYRYVKEKVIPAVNNVDIPGDLKELLAKVNMKIEELENLIKTKVKEIYRIYSKGFRRLNKYLFEKYKLSDIELGEIVA